MIEYEIGSYTEDDRPIELPEYIKKMTPEQRQQEMDRLYYDMKNNPKYPHREKGEPVRVKFCI